MLCNGNLSSHTSSVKKRRIHNMPSIFNLLSTLQKNLDCLKTSVKYGHVERDGAAKTSYLCWTIRTTTLVYTSFSWKCFQQQGTAATACKDWFNVQIQRRRFGSLSTSLAPVDHSCRRRPIRQASIDLTYVDVWLSAYILQRSADGDTYMQLTPRGGLKS